MKITLTPETDAEREAYKKHQIEIECLEAFVLVGMRRDEETGIAVPEERFHSSQPLGMPLMIGMLGVSQAKLQDILLRPPQSKIQVPTVIPQFNGVPRRI